MIDLDSLPPEQQAAVAQGMLALGPEAIVKIMADAVTVRQLLADGNRTEALAILERHRGVAEQAGMGELFQSMMNDLGL